MWGVVPRSVMKSKQATKESTAVAAASGGYPFGRYDHAMDAKKRLTIPALWRDLMGHPAYFYVVRDAKHPCLMLITKEEMEVRIERLRNGAISNPARSAALRALGENSELVSVDAAGRIRISDWLMAAAQLKGDVVFIGEGVKIEIWALANKPKEKSFNGEAMQSALELLDF